MQVQSEIIEKMNVFGRRGEPFVFLVNFLGTETYIFPPDDAENLFWKTPNKSNFANNQKCSEIKEWSINPIPFSQYKTGFDNIKSHINNGDTYLLNYTQPTKLNTSQTLNEIFHCSAAPYKIMFRNNFVCFSPETFVQIKNGRIASYPMKGTMDASIPHSKELIMNDSKELAEHNTIVDLIRNDLSLVAENVRVEKFRYLDQIKTNRRDLWQVSSKITGDLPDDYASKIGNILFSMLPAGSITGAPKKKTVEIINATEKYDRGFYTGIFGYFDGRDLDSCVLIRYIENQNGNLVYKSGGGITFMSNAKSEYEELIKKVYVPIFN